MSPQIVTAAYFGIALLFGFFGMMYYHAMQDQGKVTVLDPPLIMFISLMWMVTVPVFIFVGIASLMSFLAKKVSFILTPKEDE